MMQGCNCDFCAGTGPYAQFRSPSRHGVITPTKLDQDPQRDGRPFVDTKDLAKLMRACDVIEAVVPHGFTALVTDDRAVIFHPIEAEL